MSSTTTPARVVYPDDDGRPMSDNTWQYRWIVTLQGNLALVFRDRADVFVAGNHLIYAQEGNPKRRASPDVYVALGRPKVDRGSYKVWEEGGLFPQVVIEVRSPSNRGRELRRKYHFYQRYGALEYVLIDPDRHTLKVYHRSPAGRLQRVPTDPEYVSPLLGVKYVQRSDGLAVFYPTGEPFLTMTELGVQAEMERRRAAAEAARADYLEQTIASLEQTAAASQQRADMADRNISRVIELVEAERREKERLAAKLRELGLDPDAL